VRRLPLALGLIVALCLAVAASAATSTVSVPRKFRTVIPRVERKSHVPVLLPSRIGVDVSPSRVFGTGTATTRGYDLELGVGRHCGGANACFIAAFFGERGARPDLHRRVALAHGITGFYRGLRCGASCAPAEIEWVEGRVLYDIQ
jgi:hypothetical protein